MPIKGLTDNVMPAFPRLGKLRKGGAKPTTGFGYGKDLEYFRFTSERPEVQAVFTQAYGAQPALLNVYLPYASLDDNFQAWQEEWSAGGLVHRCDGETMTIWRTASGYSQKPEPCPWRNKERTTKTPGCKAVGRLTVVIPELIRAGFVGYVTLETHSKHDLLSIQATLLAVTEARAGIAAGLRGIPFVLRRVPETISTPGADGKRVSREKWLIKLEPAADWVSLQLETARSLALPGDRQPLQLTSGKLVDQRTGEVLDAPDDDEDIVEAEAVTQVTTPKPTPAPATPQPGPAPAPPPAADGDQSGWDALEGDLQRRAAAIRARILEHAANVTWKIDPATAEQVQKINMAFGILQPDADKRHALREYLLSHGSDAYTRGEVVVLVTWFDMSKTADGLVPCAACIEDSKVILAALTAEPIQEPSIEHGEKASRTSR